MPSPDDKHFPLAPRPRRAVSKQDYRLPKPYRRQLFSEQADRLSRLQVSLLGFAGLMVLTLLGVLALLAHETAHSPEGKLIVAASVPAPHARRAAYPARPARPDGELPPALRHGPRTAPPAKVQAKARPPRKNPPPPAHPPSVPAPAPDPDIALIAAILLLTPAPVPGAPPPLSAELAGCTREVAPSCTK